MESKIIRTNAVPYTRIPNHTLQNKQLSFQARGMLVYILSKPNNWAVSLKELTTASPAQVKATRSALHELISNGYITRTKQKGTFRLATITYDAVEKPAQPSPNHKKDTLNINYFSKNRKNKFHNKLNPNEPFPHDLP